MTVNVNCNSTDQEAPVNWREDRLFRDRSLCPFEIKLNIFDQQILDKAHMCNSKDNYIVTGVYVEDFIQILLD